MVLECIGTIFKITLRLIQQLLPIFLKEKGSKPLKIRKYTQFS